MYQNISNPGDQRQVLTRSVNCKSRAFAHHKVPVRLWLQYVLWQLVSHAKLPRMNSRVGITLMALLGLFAASAAADNIVPNGNFDGGTYQCNPQNIGSPPGNGYCIAGTTGPNVEETIADDWILDPMDDVSESNFQTVTTGGGQGGNNYVEFMSSSVPIPSADWTPGNPANIAFYENNFGEQDCLYTSLVTDIGQQYTVSFWVDLTGSIDSEQTSLLPVWNWASGSDTYMLPTGAQPNYFDPTTNQFTGWTEYTFTEAATSTSTNLMFHGTDADGAIELSSVSVTADSVAPEPSSLLLISSGLVIVGLCRRGARKDR